MTDPDPTEAQIDALARELFEMCRIHWAAPEYSQHEVYLREQARRTLALKDVK